MILSETEEMLVIILGAFMFMAIIGKTIKDYRKMSCEAKKKVAEREKTKLMLENSKR